MPCGRIETKLGGNRPETVPDLPIYPKTFNYRRKTPKEPREHIKLEKKKVPELLFIRNMILYFSRCSIYGVYFFRLPCSSWIVYLALIIKPPRGDWGTSTMELKEDHQHTVSSTGFVYEHRKQYRKTSENIAKHSNI